MGRSLQGMQDKGTSCPLPGPWVRLSFEQILRSMDTPPGLISPPKGKGVEDIPFFSVTHCRTPLGLPGPHIPLKCHGRDLGRGPPPMRGCGARERICIEMLMVRGQLFQTPSGRCPQEVPCHWGKLARSTTQRTEPGNFNSNL